MVQICKVDGCTILTRKNRRTEYCPKHTRRLELYGNPLAGQRDFYNTRKRMPGYSSWVAAKSRCYNPKDKAYKHYGARGIIMCERWFNSSKVFLEDMGSRPVGMTLERLDVNGNYELSNCKWASWAEQRKNKRHYTYREKYTHCGKGHEWTFENTGNTRTGGRYCRECSKIHDNERRLKRLEAKKTANS